MKLKLSLLLLFVSSFAFSQTSPAPVNIGGLKYERAIVQLSPAVLDSAGTVITPASYTTVQTGRVVGIEVTIAPNPDLTIPHVRTLEELQTTEDGEQELTMTARVNYYDTTGRLMVEVINADTTLSPDVKAMRLRMFDSYILAPKSTRNSWVDPSTGGLVPAGTPGAVREMTFYQNLTKANLVGMGIVPSSEQRIQFFRLYMKAYMLATIGARAGI
ncbi:MULTISPECIES: hypothetical protein [unclassified Spirosoma]|uniref:hypothetical protein n=1 Tax=unclassified Spirosoma TaxID=2621999 RepID=UPI0009627BE0|nr:MULTISPECIES: hypothetical protein [unclassified Spirosoma]MBN8820761.1 hypothetical protein [Spirosoma sp.]OJW78059.1 MAG: hypothetical protein BGO59_29005 [Spirosoma sp. 48-14]